MDLKPTPGKTEDGDRRRELEKLAESFRQHIPLMTWPTVGFRAGAAEDQPTTAAAASTIKTSREEDHRAPVHGTLVPSQHRTR
jgi:hypothetical protein